METSNLRMKTIIILTTVLITNALGLDYSKIQVRIYLFLFTS